MTFYSLISCLAGFNSVGAWSSVNHFHLQGFFPNEISSGLAFPILRQSRRQLFTHEAAVVHEFPHWPMRCYGISATEAMDATSAEMFNAVVDVAWTLIELLQRRNIPHNVLIASDEATSQPLVIVFPRQHQRENGVGLFAEYEGEQLGTPATRPGLRFAIAELSGLVVANSSISFQHFTQEAFVQILSNEISLAQVTNDSERFSHSAHPGECKISDGRVSVCVYVCLWPSPCVCLG